MWLETFLAKYRIKGWYVLLTGDVKTLANDKDKTKDKGITAKWKWIDSTDYNKNIHSQEYMACLQIFKEANTKDNKNGDKRQAWVKLSRKFDPITGASHRTMEDIIIVRTRRRNKRPQKLDHQY